MLENPHRQILLIFSQVIWNKSIRDNFKQHVQVTQLFVEKKTGSLLNQKKTISKDIANSCTKSSPKTIDPALEGGWLPPTSK